MLQKLRMMMKLWKSFNISFLGRITVIKITILPKLLYLFCALPITLNKIITRFQSYGQAPTHIFPKQCYINHTKSGGLGLPDFWLYYLAARWSQTAQWHIQNPRIPWVKFEKESINPYSIASLLWGNKVSYKHWKLHYKKCNMMSTTPP